MLTFFRLDSNLSLVYKLLDYSKAHPTVQYQLSFNKYLSYHGVYFVESASRVKMVLKQRVIQNCFYNNKQIMLVMTQFVVWNIEVMCLDKNTLRTFFIVLTFLYQDL